MHLFELIQKATELEESYGPMMNVFVLSEEDDLIKVYKVDTGYDEEGNPIIVIE